MWSKEISMMLIMSLCVALTAGLAGHHIKNKDHVWAGVFMASTVVNLIYLADLVFSK